VSSPRIDFYHLTRDPAPLVIARLAMRILGNGGKLSILADGAALRAHISAGLWAAVPESFLPHAVEEPGDVMVREPIVIHASSDRPDAMAAYRLIADGQWRAEALIGAERVFYLFDAERIDDARGAWRSLAGAHERRYWKQNAAGGWLEGP